MVFSGEGCFFKKRFRIDLCVSMHEVISTTNDDSFSWFQGEESDYLIVRVKGNEILLNREEAGLLQDLIKEFLEYT